MCAPQETILDSIKNHGIQRSHLLLLKRYHSVQALVTSVTSKYRGVGQVIGLVFRSEAHERHPDLLGQWGGTGEAYELGADEQILDLEFTTIKSRCKRIVRPGLSQVESLTILTNLRRIRWGPSTSLLDKQEGKGLKKGTIRIREIFWHFNAISDKIQLKYGE